MSFSKSFPKKTVSGPPQWEEISLSDAEEQEAIALTRSENIELMKQCIDDAKQIMNDKSLKDYQTDLIHLAISLFEKRASHEVYHKENKAKEKFDKMFK